MKKILIVAAHPDDEILGCGATMSRFIKNGCSVSTLVFGDGVTARIPPQDKNRRIREINRRKHQLYEANKILGIEEIFSFNLPDNKLDTLPLLNLVKIIEKVKNAIKPDTIFTHYENDLNVDHQLTYKAVITATRPMSTETVKNVYSFEVLSSTEWRFPLSFSPDVFFNVEEEDLRIKIKAMKKYYSEVMDYPHPRSLKNIKLNAQYWGVKTGLKYAEAFRVVRLII